MGRDFLANVGPLLAGAGQGLQSAGQGAQSFLSQVSGRATNVAGLGLDFAAMLEAAQSPESFVRFLENQALAKQDPALRAQAERSPFFAGALGLPVHALPTPTLAPGERALTELRPSLPPLTMEARAQQVLGGAEASEILAHPQEVARRKLGLPSLEAGNVPERLRALHEQYPDLQFTYQPTTGEIVPRTAATKGTYSFPTFEGAAQAGAASGMVPVRTSPTGPYTLVKPGERAVKAEELNDFAKAAGFTGVQDPNFAPYLRRLLPSPVQAPEAAPGVVSVPQTPLRDDQPVGSLVPQEPGYPSPAFVPGGPTAPPAPSPRQGGPIPLPGPTAGPTAAPGGPGLAPGSSVGLTVGPLRFRQTGPPAAGKALPAVQSRQIAQLASSAQAARKAMEILKRGPQHPLEVGGVSTGVTPPHLAGPVSGRALGLLARVSGQPLASQEVTDLTAFIAHARLGITSLTRLGGLTKDFVKEAEPLLPSVTQPTEVLERHLERLAAFYESLAVQQEAFSNMSPQQFQAATTGLFNALVVAPGPATLDLRR